MPATPPFDTVEACVFDAYGTLFDVHSAVGKCKTLFPNPDAQADKLSDIWRTRQLQYSWLRAAMGRHDPFWALTGDALDFALDSVFGADTAKPDGLREALMGAYLDLSTYPEVIDTLKTLRAAGLKTAILSNGSPDMLGPVCESTGVGPLMDAVISVEEVGVFKPHPSVYDLVRKHLGVRRTAVTFQSSNAWDAQAASDYGFRVAWINRFGQARERLPGAPDAELQRLDQLPPLLGL